MSIRGEYNGKAYGYNTRYIIEVKLKKDDSIVVPVYNKDTSVQGFKNFIIPQEALKSREELEEFLYLQAVNGKLQCEDIVVYEMEKWRQELFSRQLGDCIEAEYYSWIRYKIMGKISTIHSNYKLKLKNRKNSKAKSPLNEVR